MDKSFIYPCPNIYLSVLIKAPWTYLCDWAASEIFNKSLSKQNISEILITLFTFVLVCLNPVICYFI